MKKLNNKGFAISTILFSVLMIFISVSIITISTIASNPDKNPGIKCPNGCNNDNCVCPPTPNKVLTERCPNEFKIGTEHFCPLYIGNDYIVALAKYNLNVGDNKDAETEEGLQSAKTTEGSYGTVSALTLNELSTSYGNYDLNKIGVQSNVSKYKTTTLTNINTISANISKPLTDIIDNYSTKLNSINSTLTTKVSKIDVRLLNIDDLNDEDNFYNCIDGYNKKIIDYNNNQGYGVNSFNCKRQNAEGEDRSFLYWTQYWTGVTHKGGDNFLGTYIVSGDGFAKDFSGTSSDINGVRPVIEIPRSDFDKLPKA